MREIKFKAYDKTLKRTIEPDFIGLNGECYHAFPSYEGLEIEEDEDCILCLYTGLKDKNCKEIYEGDIVQGRNRMYEDWVIPQEVTFLNGCFMFGNWNAHEYFNKHTEIAVLGNKYENPELLEDDKN